MISAGYFLAFLLLQRRGCFFGCLERRPSTGPWGLSRSSAQPWPGYALLVGLLQIGHLFFPIHARFAVVFVSVAVLVAGGALLFGGATKMMTRKRISAALAWAVFLLGVSLLAFIPVFNGCTKSMCQIDLGLYYLKLIRWTQNFPIVPGLVNVQEQLAFSA